MSFPAENVHSAGNDPHRGASEKRGKDFSEQAKERSDPGDRKLFEVSVDVIKTENLPSGLDLHSGKAGALQGPRHALAVEVR